LGRPPPRRSHALRESAIQRSATCAVAREHRAPRPAGQSAHVRRCAAPVRYHRSGWRAAAALLVPRLPSSYRGCPPRTNRGTHGVRPPPLAVPPLAHPPLAHPSRKVVGMVRRRGAASPSAIRAWPSEPGHPSLTLTISSSPSEPHHPSLRHGGSAHDAKPAAAGASAADGSHRSVLTRSKSMHARVSCVLACKRATNQSDQLVVTRALSHRIAQ